MKTDMNGCSTTPIGEERYERFKVKTGYQYQYDYRSMNGELFSTVATTLDLCRKRRDEWLRHMV